MTRAALKKNIVPAELWERTFPVPKPLAAPGNPQEDYRIYCNRIKKSTGNSTDPQERVMRSSVCYRCCPNTLNVKEKIRSNRN